MPSSLRFIPSAAAAAALTACGPVPAEPDATEADAVAAETPTPPSPAASAFPSPADTAPDPAPLVPEAEKGETGARNVLLAWARALERGDYAAAYTQWGAEAEARSGMTAAEHAAYWQQFRTVTIAMPTGEMNGGAGSLYYEAPTTVTGERVDGRPYRLVGTVVLRRVNDVPGASPDQLRWHLEKVDLSPAA